MHGIDNIVTSTIELSIVVIIAFAICLPVDANRMHVRDNDKAGFDAGIVFEFGNQSFDIV